ncbi:MAG: hypothetical protein WC900_09635 [Oscillospiraceae bacterium]|jgi:hypothetical protein
MITDVADFIVKVNEYFGGFVNPIVEKVVASYVSRVKPSDYDKIYVYLITHNPATWHPDAKSISDAITGLGIELVSRLSETKCPVCGSYMFKAGCCVQCNYSPATDGSPEEYRKWWKSVQEGKAEIYDTRPFLNFSEKRGNEN